MKKPIDALIFTIRGQKVLLDSDLAEIYGVTTKRLNEQVKRNTERFPEDFMFQLTADEWENLKSQIATSSLEGESPEALGSQIATLDGEEVNTPKRSQSVTGSHGGRRKLPYAFTEHGAIMAATVLNSPEAVTMSVYVVRAFVQMREQMASNREILKRLAEIDQTLLQHDQALQVIWTQLQPLLAPPPEPEKRRIGFHHDEQ
ncbi:MAG: ORF6N domain-containing protein [Terrimicrobiaceae bacterium]|nr:ORF6N domain-containing protein [Terrimicrobiaceae bacterium]